MSFATPLEAIVALVAARDAGDVAAALACYSPNPTRVAQPGTVPARRGPGRCSRDPSVSAPASP
ncbi:hypothetical protein [Frankia sp. R82]|uniref:hypothetical protein n=1 Tax=Frankia sp. R82 TaxID=2950553 RepID=UPI0035ABBCAD